MRDPKQVVGLTCMLSTVLTIVHLCFYTLKRDFNIPLTYRTSFGNWSAVDNFFRSHVHNVTPGFRSPAWGTLARIAWCDTVTSSAQCACLSHYYNTTYQGYIAQWGASNLTMAQFYDLSAHGALACRLQRGSWRKDTCKSVCSVHLVTPVMLCCLFASLMLSRVLVYESRFFSRVAHYLPIVLAIVMIISLLFWDNTAGIISCFAILVALVEASYITPCTDSMMAFFSCQRFILGALASWAAVTHQARDLYLAPSYGLLGFFVGFFAYYQRFYSERKNSLAQHLCLYLWVGSTVIVGCLALLVQQNWFYNSPVNSSVVSVVSLFALLCLPSLWFSDGMHVLLGMAVLAVCSVTVLSDLGNK